MKVAGFKQRAGVLMGVAGGKRFCKGDGLAGDRGKARKYRAAGSVDAASARNYTQVVDGLRFIILPIGFDVVGVGSGASEMGLRQTGGGLFGW